MHGLLQTELFRNCAAVRLRFHWKLILQWSFKNLIPWMQKALKKGFFSIHEHYISTGFSLFLKTFYKLLISKQFWSFKWVNDSDLPKPVLLGLFVQSAQMLANSSSLLGMTSRIGLLIPPVSWGWSTGIGTARCLALTLRPAPWSGACPAIAAYHGACGHIWHLRQNIISQLKLATWL